jgi:hypothetical protein
MKRQIGAGRLEDGGRNAAGINPGSDQPDPGKELSCLGFSLLYLLFRMGWLAKGANSTGNLVHQQIIYYAMLCEASLTGMRQTKKPTSFNVGFRILAPRPGLEPGTCGLTVRRSTN